MFYEVRMKEETETWGLIIRRQVVTAVPTQGATTQVSNMPRDWRGP